jgi:hypothetical protein
MATFHSVVLNVADRKKAVLEAYKPGKISRFINYK